MVVINGTDCSPPFFYTLVSLYLYYQHNESNVFNLHYHSDKVESEVTNGHLIAHGHHLGVKDNI